MVRGPILATALVLAGCADFNATDAEVSGSASGGATGDGDVAAGTLTAGAWDDNRNYEWFQAWLQDTDPSGAPMIDPVDQDAAHDAFAGDRAPRERLDVAVLLDTTGSMGDEHAWLSAEIGGIADRIAADHPDADTRWALVVYRDQGDDYLVQSFDFTANTAGFEQTVAAQAAGGGGDTPEGVDAGLAATLALSWRADADVARLAFWIADAPGHPDAASAIAAYFRDARDADLHLYPVAASSADAVAERTMRIGAQLTGGRYLFLTDDSGVGNHHIEPTIPCYFVTLLSDAAVRMVDIELSGVYVEPDPAEILRTGGDPTNGACTLDDGQVVQAF